MKHILLPICVVFIFGCGKTAKLRGSIITLGKCQYALYNASDGVAMCHAGDCNNEIHIQSDRVVLTNGWEVYLKRESWDSEKVKAFKEAFESIYGVKK